MTDRQRLLRAVCWNQADDVARGVYADYLRENGEEDRAEFINLQLNITQGMRVGARSAKLRLKKLFIDNRDSWFQITDSRNDGWIVEMNDRIAGVAASAGVGLAVVRRGFVSTVRCTLANWTGTRCHAGCQVIHGSKHHKVYENGGPYESGWVKCEVCKGIGWMGSKGLAIVADHPVAEVTTERQPQMYPAYSTNEPTEYGWCHRRPNELYNIPREIWELLEGGANDGQHDAWIDYPTESAAQHSLSTALLNWARTKAGLPPLEFRAEP